MVRSVSLHEGVTLAELEALGRRNPALHAVARWDLVHLPEEVRFVALRREGRLLAYLLVWHGQRARPGWPVVHWRGSTLGAALLRGALPQPPYTAVVPPVVARRVAWPRPSSRHEEEIWFRARGTPRSGPAPELADGRTLRRLGPADRAVVRRYLAWHPSLPGHSQFGAGDLSRQRIFGVIEKRAHGSTLLATARTGVETEDTWMVGGVYTDPQHRGQGLARALTLAVALEAKRVGADAMLYARPENLPAVRAYRSVGFRRIARRVFIDVEAPPRERRPGPGALA